VFRKSKRRDADAKGVALGGRAVHGVRRKAVTQRATGLARTTCLNLVEETH
jgi:hypothetical protein